MAHGAYELLEVQESSDSEEMRKEACDRPVVMYHPDLQAAQRHSMEYFQSANTARGNASWDVIEREKPADEGLYIGNRLDINLPNNGELYILLLTHYLT